MYLTDRGHIYEQVSLHVAARKGTSHEEVEKMLHIHSLLSTLMLDVSFSYDRNSLFRYLPR